MSTRDNPHARPFLQAMQEYRNGALSRELTDNVAAVLAAVLKHRKKGSLTLKVTFSPESGSANGIETEAAVSTTVPRASLPKAVFFAHEGGLFRNDPGQADMFEEAHDPLTGELTERPVLRGVDGGKRDTPPPAATGEADGTTGG
jgi:hypothetical protein